MDERVDESGKRPPRWTTPIVLTVLVPLLAAPVGHRQVGPVGSPPPGPAPN